MRRENEVKLIRITKPIIFSVGITIISSVFLAVLIGLHILLAIVIGLFFGLWNYFYLRNVGIHLSQRTWICTKCGERFKINDWAEVVFAIGHLYTCKVRCTHCNEKSYCGWE